VTAFRLIKAWHKELQKIEKYRKMQAI